MELDLRQLTHMARRWWWVLLLAPILVSSSAYLVSSRQTPLYSATSVLRVSPPVNAELNQQVFTVTTNLGETYRQLITYDPVLKRVADALHLPYGSDALRAKVTASVIRDTQLIRIAVSDPDPEQAALIANTIASEFIAYQIEDTQSQIEANQATINAQVAEVQKQLASTETDLKELDVPANADNSEIQARISDLKARQVQLQSRLENLQAQSSSIVTSVTSGQIQVSISNPAQAPEAPYSPRAMFNALLGAVVGLLLAIGIVALLEYLDNTVKADTDFQALIGAPLLAAVPAIARLKPGAGQVYTMADPGSSPSEAIRLLRTNLEFAAAVAPIRTLAITSSSPSEGKSTIAANLGVVLAKAGLRTVIVDCDLHRPTQHRIFGVSNERGLSMLITHPEQGWEYHAHRVAVPGLVLIPSGPLPPNPSDLLVSGNFNAALDSIAEQADIVIIDTPPILAMSDGLIAARQADGVVLLCRAGTTKRDALQASAAAMRQGDIRLLGTVLNQKPDVGKGYGYYYSNATDMPVMPQAPTPSPQESA